MTTTNSNVKMMMVLIGLTGLLLGLLVPYMTAFSNISVNSAEIRHNRDIIIQQSKLMERYVMLTTEIVENNRQLTEIVENNRQLTEIVENNRQLIAYLTEIVENNRQLIAYLKAEYKQ